MPLPITALAATALALLLVVLTLNAIRLRARYRAPFGDAGHADLRAAIRAHANLVEYMPIGLTLLGLLEGSHAPRALLALLAALFVLMRLLHAFGLQREGNRIGPLRSAGILGTIAILATLALWLSARALPALLR